ncbi:MAG: alpha/beta hydrolase [Thermomicrobiales bacterium]|nr:alpha/beta hydrolase [Thermomicrobiales bacterium]
MAEWQTGEVEANGVTIHYTRTGGNKPVLVMAHGVTDDGLCWSPLARELEDDYDIIMVDARGHGQSDGPAGSYGPDVQAEDLAGLITALGLEKPAVLGHSMGAGTALVLAGAHPDLVGSILLEDPPAWWTEWYDTPEARELVAGMKERALNYKTLTRDEVVAAGAEGHQGWSDAELQPWADAKVAFSPNVLVVFEPSNRANVDWPVTLGRIACPVLLIMADEDRGGIITEERAAALKALTPQTEVAHIPGAGHNIRREQFGPYIDVVRTFLREHAAPVA